MIRNTQLAFQLLSQVGFIKFVGHWLDATGDTGCVYYKVVFHENIDIILFLLFHLFSALLS